MWLLKSQKDFKHPSSANQRVSSGGMLKPNNTPAVSLPKDLPPSGSKPSASRGGGTPPARKDLNRYLGASESPVPPRKENLSLNLNLRKNRKPLKSTPDQSPSEENVTFLDSPTSSLDHASSDMSTLAVERPRKKLSFREPEIMGYYMQMKQGVASRLSRKNKSPKTSVGDKGISAAQSTVVKNSAVAYETDDSDVFNLNTFSDSAEDLDLEVMYDWRILLIWPKTFVEDECCFLWNGILIL